MAARKARAGERKAGRPRSAAVEQAILRAALALFIERGLAGASIEKIARRAGVAKTSIYRRWQSRDALLAQAIETGRNESAPALTSSPRATRTATRRPASIGATLTKSASA